MINIHSDTINLLIPADESQVSKTQRENVWNTWDKIQNGFVELNDIEEQLCVILNIEPSHNIKRIIYKSAEQVKQKTGTLGTFGKNYIEKRQLKLFMTFLNKHLMSLKIFESMDKNNDHEIDENELVAATKLLTRWDVDQSKRELAKQLTVERRLTFHKFEEWLNSFEYFNVKDVDNKRKKVKS